MSSKRFIYLVGLVGAAGLWACATTPFEPQQKACSIGGLAPNGTCFEWVPEPIQDTVIWESGALSRAHVGERATPSRLH